MTHSHGCWWRHEVRDAAQAARSCFAACGGTQRLGQGFADEIDVRFGGGTGGLRLALADGGVDRGMLPHQQRTGGRDALQLAQIEADVVVHQAQQGGREMADQRIVGSLPHRLMKGDVGTRTAFEVIGSKSIVQGFERLVEARQVSLGGALGGPFGGLSFEHAAEFEHVLAQVRVRAHHVLPRVEET